MSVVPMEGLRRRGHEATPFDIIPGMDVPAVPNSNRRTRGLRSGVMAPPLLNDAIQRPHTMRVLGCKDEPMVNRTLRRPPVSAMKSISAPTGYAVGQKKGLAYEHERPITHRKILKQADNFDAGRDTPLI